ncbi:hypothetical protein TCAL_16609 [Tigriopus californicus]|uniref:Sulfotransferase domain-containing protein n=1 Tax=Tigriopus californicus TaxID=6832 RepID=A0A553NDB8_TIGCA|nr:hypothetical protein TCAL_16609 [Tigriopus californicus]
MLRYTLLRVALVISKYVNAFLKVIAGFSLFSGNLGEVQQAKRYRDKCVHRLKIHCRASMSDIGGFDSKSLFLSHLSYQSIGYLRKDEVSLAFLSKSHAYFVETRPGCNIYDTTNHPFLYAAQFQLAETIVRVSLEHFVQFSQELGDPEANVISLYSTGRCGSTLLTQMMEGVPNTIVMSEPMFQTNLLMDSKGELINTRTTHDMKEIIRAGYRVQCKPITTRQVDSFVLKSVSLVVKTAAQTQEACPFVKNVFMHRSPKPNIQSFRAMMGILKWALGFSLHSGRVSERIESECNYRKAVHRQKINWRADLGEVSPKSTQSFLLSHIGYESVDILKRDEATLLFATPTRAYFVLSPPNFDVYDTTKGVFCFVVQFSSATELLSLPLKDFLRFTNDLGDPKANVVLLSNTGRCGSTILTQMLEEVPKTLVMSEPFYFMSLVGLLDSKHPKTPLDIQADPNLLVQAGFRAQCKPWIKKQVDHVFIKSLSVTITQSAFIARCFPAVHHLFMFREPRSHMKSFFAVYQSLPRIISQVFLRFTLKEFLAQLCPADTKYGYAVEELKNIAAREFHTYKPFLVWWCLHVLNYVEYSERGWIQSFGFAYEELMDNPRDILVKILTHCGMPLTHVDACLRTMDQDSQRGSSLSRDKLKKLRTLKFTSEDVLEMNDIMAKLDFPTVENYLEIVRKNSAA